MASPLIPARWEQFLELTTAREQTVADNMANVDTPGYHTRDINFQQALESADSGFAGASLAPRIVPVNGLMERPDGNNVDIDREGMMLAKSQLEYQLGAGLVKDRFHQLLSAINGGQ